MRGGANKKEELKKYDTSHSLLGAISQIANAKGWSVHYILWKINYPLILAMLKDEPHYVPLKEWKKLHSKSKKNRSWLSELQSVLN